MQKIKGRSLQINEARGVGETFQCEKINYEDSSPFDFHPLLTSHCPFQAGISTSLRPMSKLMNSPPPQYQNIYEIFENCYSYRCYVKYL